MASLSRWGIGIGAGIMGYRSLAGMASRKTPSGYGSWAGSALDFGVKVGATGLAAGMLLRGRGIKGLTQTLPGLMRGGRAGKLGAAFAGEISSRGVFGATRRAFTRGLGQDIGTLSFGELMSRPATRKMFPAQQIRQGLAGGALGVMGLSAAGRMFGGRSPLTSARGRWDVPGIPFI